MGYPAASRHAATSPHAASAPGRQGVEPAGEARGGVDLLRVAARGPPRRRCGPHAPLRSIALRDRRGDLRELGVTTDDLLREPQDVHAAEGRRQAETLDRPETIVHVDELTEGDCNDPLTEIIITGASVQLALHGESGP